MHKYVANKIFEGSRQLDTPEVILFSHKKHKIYSYFCLNFGKVIILNILNLATLKWTPVEPLQRSSRLGTHYRQLQNISIRTTILHIDIQSQIITINSIHIPAFTKV